MKISIFLVACFVLPSLLAAQDSRIVIRAGTVLDGTGRVLHNIAITVQGSKIQSIGQTASKPTYDLTSLTLLPGLIDTHVHIGWHFGLDGRYAPRDDSPSVALSYGMENVYVTLMGGFTTVQSVGSASDRDLRDAINRGVLPGPRILTSLQPINDPKLSVEQLRQAVRKNAADGADLIKMFASKSMREGAGQTLSDEQIQAVCSEAKAVHLRTLVHVYKSSTIRTVVDAGCTSVEHGNLIDTPTLQLLADRGTYFDPNVGLVLQNYVKNKDRFIGTGSYSEAGMADIVNRLIPLSLATFKRALTIKNLKIIYGTDAVAGAHGHNIEELIYRVERGGQPTDAAIRSITSGSAESLNMADRIGTLKSGMQADIIAVAGDPLKDITAMRRVAFVMKDGKIFKGGAFGMQSTTVR